MKHYQGHKYILSLDDNEQLMLALHETCEVKQTARPYLRLFVCLFVVCIHL